MSNNLQTVKLSDGREVCLSYGVVVAAFIPGRGYLRTSERYSVTTSKHMNAFAGKDAPEVDGATLRQLCTPVTDRRTV